MGVAIRGAIPITVKMAPQRQIIKLQWRWHKSNSNGSCQKRDAKCHFATLNSVLPPMNSVFALMVGVKMGCHYNNSMFFIKKYN